MSYPFMVVIPARHDSKRLPGKLTRLLAGRSVLERSYAAACASGAKEVLIAAADDRIRVVAEAFGARVCMTSPKHRSGTERISEVVARLRLEAKTLVVNMQGDEPLLPPRLLDQLAALLAATPGASGASLYTPLEDEEQAADPDVVKVVLDECGRAMYFSRALIPARRGAAARKPDLPYLRHIGVYAYWAGTLLRYRYLKETALECNEQLEQLRLLGRGEWLQMEQALEVPERGVDTAQDLRRLQAHFKSAEARARSAVARKAGGGGPGR